MAKGKGVFINCLLKSMTFDVVKGLYYRYSPDMLQTNQSLHHLTKYGTIPKN